MALVSGFSALLGGAIGSKLFDAGRSAFRAVGSTAFGKAVGSAATATRGAISGLLGKISPIRNAAKQTERWASTFGETGASKVGGLFDSLMTPVPRAFPGSEAGLEGAAKAAQEKMISKSTRNLFLGFKFNKGAQIGIGAGVVAGLAVKEGTSVLKSKSYGRPYDGLMESAGEMPRMAGDMSGSVAEGRRDLGATGDLVLALNRRR